MLTRLAMGIVEREDDDVTMEKLDKALGDLFEKKVKQPARKMKRGVASRPFTKIKSIESIIVGHPAPGLCVLPFCVSTQILNTIPPPCALSRFLANAQALAQERLEGYRLHVEQAREEIEILQVRTIHFFFDLQCEENVGFKEEHIPQLEDYCQLHSFPLLSLTGGGSTDGEKLQEGNPRSRVKPHRHGGNDGAAGAGTEVENRP